MSVHIVKTMPGKFEKSARKKRRAAAEASAAAKQPVVSAPKQAPAPAAQPLTRGLHRATTPEETCLNLDDSPDPDEEGEPEAFR